MIGIWNLATPRDLFAKLEHDLERMKAAPRDARPAYDFFVSAFHLADWVAGSKAKAGILVQKSPLLEIAGTIANSGKHWVLTDQRFKRQVESADAPSRTRASLNGGSMANRRGLSIRLTKRYENALGQKHVLAVDLAERLLEFWRPIVEKKGRP